MSVTPDAHGRRIAVVDDNVDAADLLAELLRAHGHEVEVAYDSGGALAVLDRFDPDVMLLDIGLPDMDGYQLAAEIRRRRARPPRLVALTGYSDVSDRERSAAAGFDAHLVKPVDDRTVLAVLT